MVPCDCEVILLLGPPSSGKSLLACELASVFDFEHLDMTAVLRHVRPAKDKRNEQANLEKFAISTVDEALGRQKGGLILSGFPTSMTEASLWNTRWASARLSAVLVLEAPEDTLRTRAVMQFGGGPRAEEAMRAFDEQMASFKNKTWKAVEHFSQRKMVRVVKSDVTVDEMVKTACTHVAELVRERQKQEESLLMVRTPSIASPSFPAMAREGVPCDCDVMILIGPPCSGKSTLGSRLATVHGFSFLDMDELLRATDAPKDAVESSAIEAVDAALEQDRGLVLAGFPNMMPGALLWERRWAEARLLAVLVLEAPDDLLRERAADRLEDGVDEEESAQAFEERLMLFKTTTWKVVEHFCKRKIARFVASDVDVDNMIIEACSHVAELVGYRYGVVAEAEISLSVQDMEESGSTAFTTVDSRSVSEILGRGNSRKLLGDDCAAPLRLLSKDTDQNENEANTFAALGLGTANHQALPWAGRAAPSFGGALLESSTQPNILRRWSASAVF